MHERPSMTKYKFFWDYKKEEAWINQMAQEGFHLIDFTTGKYVFEKGIPGEYVYRYQYSPEETSAERAAQAEKNKKSGVQIIRSQGGWLVLRKKSASGSFPVLVADEEKIRHYQSLMRAANTLAIICLVFGIVNVTNSSQLSQFLAILGFTAGVILFVLISLFAARVRQLRSTLTKKQ